jgi:hypothetical protein
MTGRTDWLACGDRHALIESGDYHGLWQRCAPCSEPMPVQAAWLQFRAGRGPARPYDAPEPAAAPSLVYVSRGGWNPAGRKRMARELATAWTTPFQDGDGVPRGLWIFGSRFPRRNSMRTDQVAPLASNAWAADSYGSAAPTRTTAVARADTQ